MPHAAPGLPMLTLGFLLGIINEPGNLGTMTGCAQSLQVAIQMAARALLGKERGKIPDAIPGILLE
jgi:hypothetical protein